MNCLVVGGYGVNRQPAQRGADDAVHVAGCLTLRAIFPQNRIALQDASGRRVADPEDGEALPLSHSGMSCKGALTPSTGELLNSHIRADQLSGHYPY